METSLLVCTLIYWLLAICVAFPPTEFISIGLTVDCIFKRLLFQGLEHLGFIQYHLKRTSLNRLIHSLLPFGYFVVLECTPDATVNVFTAFADQQLMWQLGFGISVILPISIGSLVYYWHMANWSNHPLVKILQLYDSDWQRAALMIDTEYRRVDKFTASLGGTNRIIVTDSWVIKVTSYEVNLSQQADVRLSISATDEHSMSHLAQDGAQVGVQFLNITVETVSKPIQPFVLRLNALDYDTLRMKMQSPIRAARDIIIHQSLSERFVDAFMGQVAHNLRYPMSDEAKRSLDPCIGCMQVTSNAKLEKQCSDEAPVRIDADGNRLPSCAKCYCRPMWCVACMGRWFASRQIQTRPETWMAGVSPCPTCRAVFCVLDVCMVE